MVSLGAALSNLRKQKKAIKAYEKGLLIAPQNAEAWYNKGLAFAKLGKVREAFISSEKAIQIDGRNAAAWFLCGVTLIDLQRYDESLIHLEQALEIDPQNARVWLKKGFVLLRVERYQEAIEAFEKTLQIDPKNSEAWSYKVAIFIKLGKVEEAFESSKKLAEVRSQEVDIDKVMSWKEKFFLAKKNAQNMSNKKIIGEFIDMQIRILNVFNRTHFTEPLKTQLNIEATCEPTCEYSYWTTKKKCFRPLLKGYDKCFWHVADINKYGSKIMEEYFGSPISLKDALEAEVRAENSLEGAYLRKASVGGDWFYQGPMLAGAILRRANLSEAHLSCGSLSGADLTMANMEEAYLSDVDFRNTNFWYAKLHQAKFRNNDFAGAKGLSKDNFQGWKYGVIPVYRILETYPDQCEWVYRGLAKNFMENGLFDDASWATYRERLMRHKMLLPGLSVYKLLARIMFQEQSQLVPLMKGIKGFTALCARWVHNLIKLVISYFSRFIWGYGERPIRVGLTAALVIMGYAALFTQHGALLDGSIAKSDFKSALYFSIVTFTTLGYGDVKPTHEFRMWAASEAIIGAILMGLFLFTLARRASGRG